MRDIMRALILALFLLATSACGGETAQATAPEAPAQVTTAEAKAPLAPAKEVAPAVPGAAVAPTPSTSPPAAAPQPASLCADLDAWIPELRKATSDAANVLVDWRERKAALDSTRADPNKVDTAYYRMLLAMMDKMSRDTGQRGQELKQRLTVLEQQRVPAEEEPIRRDLSNGYSAVVTCFEQHSAAWSEGISAMTKIAAVDQLCGEINGAAGKLEREVRAACKRLERSGKGSEMARGTQAGAKKPGKCVPCRYNGDCDVLQSEDGECCLPIKGDDEAHEAECKANGPINLPPPD